MFEGDVNLSVTMTFISSLGSFAFTTMWVYLLGAPMVGQSVPIPYLQLTVSLALFAVPLLLGVVINHKLPKLAGRLRKLSRPFFLLLLIIFPVVGSLQNLHFFYLCQWQHFLAGIGLGKVKCPLHSPDNITAVLNGHQPKLNSLSNCSKYFLFPLVQGEFCCVS